MFLKKIYLENFKCFTKFEHELGPGVTVILGPNGSGKSSLVEAIFFGLYGRSDRKLENLIKFGENSAKIVMELYDINENNIMIVERVLNKTEMGASHQVFINSEKKMVTEANDILSNMFMRRDIFENTYSVKQGELLRLLNMTPLNRKEFLDECFDIMDLEKAWQNMRYLMQDVENYVVKSEIIINELRIQLEPILSSKNELLYMISSEESANSEIKDIQIQMSGETSRINEISYVLDNFERNKSVLEMINLELNDLGERERRVLITIKNNLLKTNIVLSELKSIVNGYNNKYDNNINVMMDYINDIDNQCKYIKSEKIISRIRNNENIFVDFLHIEDIISEHNDALNDINNNIKEYKYKQDEIYKSINLITFNKEELKNSLCPVCKRELNMRMIKTVIKHYEAEKKYINEEIKNYKIQYEIKRTNYVILNNIKSKLNDNVNKLTQKYNEYLYINNNKLNFKDRQLQTNKKLQELTRMKKEYNQLTMRDKNLQKQYSEKMTALIELQIKIEQEKRNVQKFEELTSRITEQNKSLNLLKHHELMLNSIRTSYRILQPSIRSEYVKSLTNEVNSLLKNINITYKVIITPDYEINITNNQGIFTSDALSAGQQCILGLMLKLGLAKILGESNEILLLDEPTEFLDDTNTKNVFISLQHLTNYEQIIVATHKKVATETASNIIPLTLT